MLVINIQLKYHCLCHLLLRRVKSMNSQHLYNALSQSPFTFLTVLLNIK